MLSFNAIASEDPAVKRSSQRYLERDQITGPWTQFAPDIRPGCIHGHGTRRRGRVALTCGVSKHLMPGRVMMPAEGSIRLRMARDFAHNLDPVPPRRFGMRWKVRYDAQP